MKKDMRIFKYEVGFNSSFALSVGAKVLKVGVQDGRSYVWILCDVASEELASIVLRIYGTGQPLPADVEQARYVDTYFDGPYVWHLFDYSEVET